MLFRSTLTVTGEFSVTGIEAQGSVNLNKSMINVTSASKIPPASPGGITADGILAQGSVTATNSRINVTIVGTEIVPEALARGISALEVVKINNSVVTATTNVEHGIARAVGIKGTTVIVNHANITVSAKGDTANVSGIFSPQSVTFKGNPSVVTAIHSGPGVLLPIESPIVNNNSAPKSQ